MMKRNTRCIHSIPAILFILAVFAGCEYKPQSLGRSRDIMVYTPYKELIEDELSIGLEQLVFTPQPVKEFNLRYMTAEDLYMRQKQHAMLFVGIEGDSLVSAVFPALTAKDSFTLYDVNDLWAKDQTLLVLLATDTSWLVPAIRTLRGRMHDRYKEQQLLRLKGITYGNQGEDRKLSAKLEPYGFKLKIPHDWFVREEYTDENFLWLLHSRDPSRAIFVYWEEEERPSLHPADMMALRDSLTTRFYDNDYLDSSTTAGPFYFKGRQGVRISGAWQNDSLIVGGPMVNYCFNEDGRFYMIDAMLFYPEIPSRKLVWLNQLEVIMATFEDIDG